MAEKTRENKEQSETPRPAAEESEDRQTREMEPGAAAGPRVPTAPTRHELGGEEPETRVEARGDADATRHDEEADDDDVLGKKIRDRLEGFDAEGPSPDSLIGQEIGGRFTVTQKIGTGGFGAVYRARQRGMDRDVAIKVLLGQLTGNETIVRRFHLEALAVSKLRHPNTIQIFDFGETDANELYIAMEFLEGRSLHELLHDEGVVAAKRAVKIAAQICKSLREAHGKGIVHRDLKPENVFLISIGEDADFVKVLDFGVAKLKEGDDSQATLTKAGAVFGTPRYMSPEQSVSSAVDHRSDLYSIGIMLYEMATGRVPFDAPNPLAILIKHVQDDVPRFHEVRPDLVLPPQLEDLVMRLLAKRPEDRPQTAEALIRLLDTVESEMDDIYRHVVTAEYADKVGLDRRVAAGTEVDTRRTGGTSATQIQPMAGDATTVYEETAPEELRPRKKRGLLWAAVGLLAAVVATGGALFATMEPLPRSFASVGRLSDLRVGELPAVELPEVAPEAPSGGTTDEPAPGPAGAATAPEKVQLIIASEPSEAEVLRDGNPAGTTPYLLSAAKGSEPATLTFRKQGYKDLEQTFTFEEGGSTTVKLKRAWKPAPVPTTPAGETKSDPGTKTEPAVAKDPETKPPADQPKAGETKANPYGSGKATETKDNPYAR